MAIRHLLKTFSNIMDLGVMLMAMGLFFYALLQIMIQHNYENTTFTLLLVSMLFVEKVAARFKSKPSETDRDKTSSH